MGDFWTPLPGVDDDAIHDNVAGEIAAITEKTTPVSADLILIEDSAASNAKKKVQIGNLPSGGGGGGDVPEWISYLAARQAGETAHTDDDFFDDDTVPGTTLTVSGSATWTEGLGRLNVEADIGVGGDVSAVMVALTTPSAPLTVETRATINLTMHTTGVAGIGFTDGVTATDDIVWAAMFTLNSTPFRGWRSRVGTLTNVFGVTNAAVGVDGGSTGTGFANTPVYMRTIWVSSNTFKVGFSLDGTHWIYGANMTPTFTPTHSAIVATNDGASQSVFASYDYLRVADADLSV